MIMEKIQKLTNDIDPSFWVQFYDVSNLNLSKNTNYKQFAIMFDLLIFIINQVATIYEENCDNYLNILNMLSVYSVLVKEFIFAIKSQVINEDIKNEIVDEFITILSCEDIYKDLINDDKINNKIILKNIDVLKAKVKNLYLKLIKFI